MSVQKTTNNAWHMLLHCIANLKGRKELVPIVRCASGMKWGKKPTLVQNQELSQKANSPLVLCLTI